jgi:hydroxymethylbilane synthase
MGSEVVLSVVRIGTRGSPLALAQAHMVRAQLMAAHALTEAHLPITVIKTSGDIIQDRPLSEVGGKGLFTKEIEEALTNGTIDLAVHSMKDVATRLPDGLSIAAILEREDPRDAFISLSVPTLAALPRGAIVGSSSLRRQAQVKAARPDLQVIQFRGNVETRLRKLADGLAQATFLAVAGLNRLGLQTHITSAVAADDMLPAVAQGAVGIEIRTDDAKVATLVGALDHQPSHIAVACERAFLARLDGSCRTPIAGYANLTADGQMTFRGEILLPDGSVRHATARQGSQRDAARLGDDAAVELLKRAGPNFLAAV